MYNAQQIEKTTPKKKRFKKYDFVIPYGRHWVDEEDIQAVVEALRSDWLTTGPKVSAFEQSVTQYTDATYGVAVSSGTAALHCAMAAVGIGPQDEVVIPPMTFAATANCVAFQRGKPVFADVDPDTLLIDPKRVEEKITKNTKAIIAVDYAGHPCDFNALRDIADNHHLVLIDDACHALGAEYKSRKVGSLADMTLFSFHPVKHITTGEGGMIVTDCERFEKTLRRFRNHGINADHHQRTKQVSWFYEMVDLGFNYRIPDILCALGISQMKKLPRVLERRREIAETYHNALEAIPGVSPLTLQKEVVHAYHLFVIRINKKESGKDRSTVFHKLKEQGIQVNVHYIPVHLHPYYRKTFQTGPGDCPVAETAYEEILSLPMYPKMSNNDVERVIRVLKRVFSS